MMTWAPCPHGVRTRGKKSLDAAALTARWTFDKRKVQQRGRMWLVHTVGAWHSWDQHTGACPRGWQASVDVSLQPCVTIGPAILQVRVVNIFLKVALGVCAVGKLLVWILARMASSRDTKESSARHADFSQGDALEEGFLLDLSALQVDSAQKHSSSVISVCESLLPLLREVRRAPLCVFACNILRQLLATVASLVQLCGIVVP